MKRHNSHANKILPIVLPMLSTMASNPNVCKPSMIRRLQPTSMKSKNSSIHINDVMMGRIHFSSFFLDEKPMPIPKSMMPTIFNMTIYERVV